MAKQGYIKLSRQIQECWVWNDKPYAMGQAWVDLIMLANHEDKKEYRDGRLMEFKRGTVSRSIQSLSDRWGWDRKKTRRFLDALESDNMVTVNSTTHGTTIVLVNYEVFNSRWTTDSTTEGQPKDNRGTTDGQPMDINKNDKNVKNDKECKEEGKPKRFSPPTVDDVKAYCSERNNSVDAERFVDFYSSKGWKVGNQPMKDWKACVRTWEKRDTEKKQKMSPFIQGTLEDDLDEIERLTRRKVQ